MRSTRRDARRRIVVATTVFLITAAVVPAVASGFSAVTMFSEPGDYIGGGVERIYHPGNSEISLSGTRAGVTVGVSGGTRGDYFNLTFAAPSGDQLEEGGVYYGAQRSSFREAGRPGIDISGDGRGCNEQLGNFEVMDLETDSAGKVIRLSLVYEQHCEGGVPALFGEVRYGYAAPTGPAAIPTLVRWPVAELQDPSTVQPVTLVAWNAPVTVSRVALAGPDAAAFSIRADECTGKTLAAGTSCQVFVRFDAPTAGTKHGALQLTHGGGVTEVELDGHARGGRTQLVMDSESGDWIGGGVDRTYTPQNATIAGGGSRRFVWMNVEADDGDWWSADFEVGDGDIIAAGRTYSNATRYPFNNDGNGMSISGSGRGCNTLTGWFAVDEATFDADGGLESLSLRYEQHCEGGSAALRGVVEWRAGDTTGEPTWLGGSGSGAPGENPPPPWTPPEDTDAAPGAPAYDEATAPVHEPAPATPVSRTTTAAPTTRTAMPMPPADGDDVTACGRRAVTAVAGPRGTARGDRLRASLRGDLVFAGGGNDLVWALRGDDCVDGGAGADILSGGAGSDVLLGGAGADRLVGGAGRDVLVGGPGRDVLRCGRGRDVAHVQRGDRVAGCERLIRRA